MNQANNKNHNNNENRKCVKGPSPGMFVFLIMFLLTITIFLNGCDILNLRTGSLEGVVHRQTTTGSAPLPDALVSVSGSINTAETDENGYFLLNEIPAGKRNITVIKEGYITVKLLNVYIEPEIVNEANVGNPIVLMPTEEKILFDTAIEFFEQEDYQQASDAFQEFLYTYPDSTWADDAQYYIGYINETKFKLYIVARDEYSILLLYYPDSTWADDARLGIGNCYYATEDYSNAINEYRKVLDSYPGSELYPIAQYSIAWSYRKAGSHDQAIIEFQQVIDLYPDSIYTPPAQYFIGEIYYALGQYSQAIVNFQETINNYPQSSWPQEDRLIAPPAYFYIGYCYEKLESWEEAVMAYQIIIDTYPYSKWPDGSSIATDAQERVDYIIANYLPPDEEPDDEHI